MERKVHRRFYDKIFARSAFALINVSNHIVLQNPLCKHKPISSQNERSKAKRGANRPWGLPPTIFDLSNPKTNPLREHKPISFQNERSKSERSANRPWGLPRTTISIYKILKQTLFANTNPFPFKTSAAKRSVARTARGGFPALFSA